jgi:hypothetical protein
MQCKFYRSDLCDAASTYIGIAATLLQSPAMSVMRRAARMESDAHTRQHMNWKSFTNWPDGRFESGGIAPRIQIRSGDKPGA